MIRWLMRRIFQIESAFAADRNAIRAQQIIRRKTDRPRRQLYWKHRRWSHQNGAYEGYYRTLEGRWAGRIVDNNSGCEFTISDPPKYLQKHPNWHCFNHIGNKTYRVHFYEDPNVDDGILAIEQMLHEAWLRWGKKKSPKHSRQSRRSRPESPRVVPGPQIIRAMAKQKTEKRPSPLPTWDYQKEHEQIFHRPRQSPFNSELLTSMNSTRPELFLRTLLLNDDKPEISTLPSYSSLYPKEKESF